MDYEKMYKEALERADSLTEKYGGRTFAEYIFPELAESEDERIKKTIRQLLETARDAHSNTTLAKPFIDALAWLEKQKEPLPIPNKFSGLKSLMLQYLQSAANRKDDTEIESDTDLWGRKILDYVWKYDEKQKVQKPGWSEEDEKMRDRLITRLNWITYNTRTDGTSPNITFFDEIAWLKSLRPQYHGDVTMTEAYKMGLEAGKASSWKPSEHQMTILKAVKDYVGVGSGYWGEALASLIEDLEKL